MVCREFHGFSLPWSLSHRDNEFIVSWGFDIGHYAYKLRVRPLLQQKLKHSFFTNFLPNQVLDLWLLQWKRLFTLYFLRVWTQPILHPEHFGNNICGDTIAQHFLITLYFRCLTKSSSQGELIWIQELTNCLSKSNDGSILGISVNQYDSCFIK